MEIITLTSEQAEELKSMVLGSNVIEPYRTWLIQVIHTLLFIYQNLARAKTSIKNLKDLVFGPKTEKAKKTRGVRKAPRTKGRDNHGRSGVKDYPDAEKIVYIPAEKTGDQCTVCGPGKLQPSEPRVKLRFLARPMIVPQVHERQRLVCPSCGRVITAPGPRGRYDETVGALLALMKYGLGMPLYRMASLTNWFKVTMSPSTQWDIIEKMADHAAPVFNYLRLEAAHARQVHIDDTNQRILALLKENQEENPERRGIFCTGMVFQLSGHEIALYSTGRRHAGENLADVLQHRDPSEPVVILVSDALSRNRPQGCLVIWVKCLVHGRRLFIRCQADFPAECGYVIDRIALVYKNEEQCQGLDDQARLVFHQAHSQAPMNQIEAYCQAKLLNHEVEPNSAAGDAFQYMLTHWQGLTQFLRVPGAALDNNTVERMLKIPIRLRKSAMFYKTAHGAAVGDILMSLIQTCDRNGINPFEYLTALQKNHGEVFRNPHAWLPWNYQEHEKQTAA